MVRSDREMTDPGDAQHQRPRVGQPWVGGFHPLTQHSQVAREVTIMERTQFHVQGVFAPQDLPRQADERCQSTPRRMPHSRPESKAGYTYLGSPLPFAPVQ